ncbi:MAG TPA: hypothetical protein GX008_06575 [Firmicutes bacterium]|nr:hypothetical protein [Bacillota bacterium]
MRNEKITKPVPKHNRCSSCIGCALCRRQCPSDLVCEASRSYAL